MKKAILIIALCLITCAANAGIESIASGSDGLTISSSATDLGTNWTVNFFASVTNPNLPFGIAPFFARTTYNGSGDPTCGELIAYYSPGGANSRMAIDLALHTPGAPNGLIGQPGAILSSNFQIADTNYHQFTITRAGSVWTLYVDAVLDTSVTLAVPTFTGCNFQLFVDLANGGSEACGNTAGSQNFCGLAEVSAFTSVFTPQQVRALKSTPATVLGKPIYYWPGYLGSQKVAEIGAGEWTGSAAQATVTINHVGTGMPTGENH